MESTFSDKFFEQKLEIIDIIVPEHIELKKHIVLFPPIPCCAQLAAPFWAKIKGTIENKDAKEYLIKIAVSLYDGHREEIKKCSETMFLESKRTSEFDIQIPHLNPIPSMYSIEIKIVEEV